MIEIVLGKLHGQVRRILLFKARFKMISSPKKSSSDISFNHILHTQVVEPHCFFIIIILFVAHVQFETGGQEYKRGRYKRNFARKT